MLGAEPMVVADASRDARFADNPLVTGRPGVRFYAGQPLISREGAPLGALCVIDRVPRPAGLTALQRQGLAVLAEAVMRRLMQVRSDRVANAAIARREQRLKVMIDSVPGIAWSSDEAGNLDYVNARWNEATGAPIPRSAAELARFIHPDDRESSLARWVAAMRRGEPHEDEIRMRQKDGSYRWVLSRAIPVTEGDGGNRWFGTVIDVDSAKRLSEARDLLANELSHRIKNIFAVVSGLVTMRARGRPEVEEFAREINAAIRSLAVAHDYVRPHDGRSSDSLQGLLADLLRPYDTGGDRVVIEGEDIAIGSRAATPLALIFHELATNAAKYGALSQPEGRVHITLARPRQEGDPLRVTWRECSRGFSGRTGCGGRGFRIAPAQARRRRPARRQLRTALFRPRPRCRDYRSGAQARGIAGVASARRGPYGRRHRKESMMNRSRMIAPLLMLALGACAPSADNSNSAVPSSPAAAAMAASTPSADPAPEGFAATAWRADAENGARYTTYLDPDGTYRDLRNGDPWQRGSWSYTAGDEARLCFTPEAEGGVRRCWTPEPLSDETMAATDAQGRRIELERVEYAPPPEAPDDSASQ